MAAKLFLNILIFLIGMSVANAQTTRTETADIQKLLQEFNRVRYGGWFRFAPAFRELGNTAIEPLLDLLKKSETGPDADYRIEWNQRRAAWALGEIGTPEANSRLIEMVQDTTLHDGGRHEAARTLGRKNIRSAINPLIKLLKNRQENQPPRFGAAYALGDLRAEAAVPAYVAALTEPNTRLRMGAVYALGKIGTETAVTTLLSALSDPDGSIRSQAYRHLKVLKPELKDSLLLRALEDADWGVRESAVKDLVQMGEPVRELVLPLLQAKNTRLRWQAVRILGQFSDPNGLAPLCQALKDADWMVRNQAAVSLAKINEPTAVSDLVQILKGENIFAAREAAWILGEMQAESAVPNLVEALRKPEIFPDAFTALDKIATPAARQAIQNVSGDRR